MSVSYSRVFRGGEIGHNNAERTMGVRRSVSRAAAGKKSVTFFMLPEHAKRH